MTESARVLLSAVVAAFMVALLRSGVSTGLRAVIRATTMVILGWVMAWAHYGPKSWSDLS